jgi:hypothetical protein
MGVDSFWKRVPSEAINGCEPKALSSLVPYWFDDRFKIEQDNGILVGAEDTGALIDALLRFGATGEAGAAAVAIFTHLPPDWNDHWMVGTLSPDAVGQISEFLADAPLNEWAEGHRAAMAAEAQALGYHRPFDDDWADQVLSDAREVVELFRAAAASKEAVIVKISA